MLNAVAQEEPLGTLMISHTKLALSSGNLPMQLNHHHRAIRFQYLKTQTSGGFTLLEMMVLLATIGILFAIALPVGMPCLTGCVSAQLKTKYFRRYARLKAKPNSIVSTGKPAFGTTRELCNGSFIRSESRQMIPFGTISTQMFNWTKLKPPCRTRKEFVKSSLII